MNIVKEILLSKSIKGQIIGDEILYNNNNKYEFSAVVQTNNFKYFYINKKDINHHFPYEMLKNINANYESKEQKRIMRFTKFSEMAIKESFKRDGINDALD